MTTDVSIKHGKMTRVGVNELVSNRSISENNVTMTCEASDDDLTNDQPRTGNKRDGGKTQQEKLMEPYARSFDFEVPKDEKADANLGLRLVACDSLVKASKVKV